MIKAFTPDNTAHGNLILNIYLLDHLDRHRETMIVHDKLYRIIPI